MASIIQSSRLTMNQQLYNWLKSLDANYIYLGDTQQPTSTKDKVQWNDSTRHCLHNCGQSTLTSWT
eukprot:4548671-Amphidinium_carterae.1